MVNHSSASSRVGISSWYDLDCSELVKVVIEGECYLDIELFHDDFACAVSEAPTLIVELLKDLPCKVQVCGSDLVYFRELMMKELCP